MKMNCISLATYESCVVLFFLYTETVKSVNKLISFIADSDKPLNSFAAYG